ncbi:radA [Scenedesmus sp. PABB004]|nr:radA [Scenedesmus sp. PABB004]
MDVALASRVGLQLLLEPQSTAFIARGACVAVGALYPAYASYKAVRAPHRPPGLGRASAAAHALESERWLKVPYYPHAKLVLLLWLQLHGGHGAALLFESQLAPRLARYERKLDTVLEVAARGLDVLLTTYAAPIALLRSSFALALAQIASFAQWIATPDDPPPDGDPAAAAAAAASAPAARSCRRGAARAVRLAHSGSSSGAWTVTSARMASISGALAVPGGLGARRVGGGPAAAAAAATPRWLGGAGAALARPLPWAVPAAPLRQATRCAASKSGARPKVVHRCSACGEEHAQWHGQCRGCGAWSTLQTVELQPEPPPSAASGAAAAAAALRAKPGTAGRSRGGAARGSGAFSPYRLPPGSSVDDDGSIDDDDGGYAPRGAFAGAGGGFGGVLGGWVAVADGDAPAVPQRLSDMSVAAAALRLPLHGATGAEVSRVLGGGLVPGSLVLVGGEPGMGKSTLLLQVAGLVAQACRGAAAQHAPAGEGEGVASLSEGEASGDDDLPLAARRAVAARAAAPQSAPGCSSGGGAGWLEDAEAAAAAGGAAATPPGFAGRPVLYVTAEESSEQVWERARRLGLVGAPGGRGLDVRLLVENRVDAIAAAVAALAPAALVVDSIQTVALRDVPGRPGSITQVRESASCLLHVAKSMRCATFLVGHVTKGGAIAGPKHLEHQVDVVLYLQGAGGGRGPGGSGGGLRMLRAVKNRHGRVGEVGLFTMAGPGLAAVTDAASLFLPSTAAAAEAAAGAAASRGAARGCEAEDGGAAYGDDAADEAAEGEEGEAYDDGDDDDDDGDSDSEGERGFSPWPRGGAAWRGGAASPGPTPSRPYRHYAGVGDRPRLEMLLQLLSKYTPVKCGAFSLFVNVVSGYKIPPGETSTDLPLLAAVASSAANAPLPPRTAALGEVGLAGELRPVQNLELRLLELAKLGFTQAVVPAAGGALALDPGELGGLSVVRCGTLAGALEHLLGDEALRGAGWRRGGASRSASRSGWPPRAGATARSLRQTPIVGVERRDAIAQALGVLLANSSDTNITVTVLGSFVIDYGAYLAKEDKRKLVTRPDVAWPAPDPDAKYTLALVDPDAPNGQQGGGNARYLHWLVVNIPGSNTTAGQEAVSFAPPSPPRGVHRFVFVLYRQPPGLDVSVAKPIKRRSARVGAVQGFDLAAWAAGAGLGNAAAGLTYFTLAARTSRTSRTAGALLPMTPGPDAKSACNGSLALPDDRVASVLLRGLAELGLPASNRYATSWRPDTSTCTWLGVSCTDGRATGIYIYVGNGEGPLTGRLPRAWGELGPGLESLFIYSRRNYNLSATSWPEEWRNLTGLKTLYLGRLGMSGPLSLAALPPNVERVDIAGSRFTSMSDDVAPGALPALSWLYIRQGVNHRISGPLPPSWGALTALQSLDLHGLGLTGPLPGAWGALAALQSLDLHGQALTGPLPGAWSGMAALHELHLQGNSLGGPLPAAWGGGMASLKRLDLSRNNITGSIPEAWAGLAAGLVLLHHNALSGSLPPRVFMNNVKILDLSHNQLTGRIDGWKGWALRGARCSGPDGQAYLSLAHNQLTGPLPEVPAGRVSIDLSDNALTSTLPAAWARWTYREGCYSNVGLNLANNQLRGPLPPEWGDWTRPNKQARLGALNLTGNPLNATLPPEWGGMELWQLDVSYCDLRGEIPASWAASKLSGLAITDNPQLSGCLPRAWLERDGALLVHPRVCELPEGCTTM